MAKIQDQQFIIAIGASAGGLEAIAAFFDYTPLDAVSYILIQHLSADFKSQMVHILARHSKLKVVEAEHDMEIQSNTVYLIPSTKFMTIEKGILNLLDKKEQPRPHMTIDYFFISLAKERGDKAIGIVLSGTGNDGSKGIMAIKNAGGMVLVQDPATANSGAMPLAAIATGCTDQILSPEAMPQVIEDYVKDGALANQSSAQITEVELGQILSLIRSSLPLDFTDYKRPTMIRRILRRMESYDLKKVVEYYQLLKGNASEISLLANDFLISVTSFFRDADAFRIIAETVIPDIITRNNTAVLKIWVAGCATGEEAYSLAILIKEYLNKYPKNMEVKIFATDLSKAALDIASKGVYADKINKTVSEKRLKQFFTRAGSGYKINREIREMLIFAQHDLTTNPPYCNMDLISCRNLLIYLNVMLQKKVFGLLHYGLKEGGYLILGPSESTAVIKDGFDEISTKWNILKSNKTGRAVRFVTFPANNMGELKAARIEVDKKNRLPVSPSELTSQVNAALLRESALNGVCTDQNLSVVQSFGNTRPYLKNINFNNNLNDLLPDHLLIAFKSAAHRALKLGEKVMLDQLNLYPRAENKSKLINIVLSPFDMTGSEEKLLLVIFTESIAAAGKTGVIHAEDISEVTRQHLTSLEQEIVSLKHTVDVAHDRIASSNENMQSFNEELQSSNEEMHSTNEELQSVNEELQTVNKEHQLTIDELTDLNDDLNNYFRSNTNGQLFVDHELLLKRYSPGAVKHINIRESDIGRPLSNITTNIIFETLIADIEKVIADQEPIIREAEATDGRVYQVMTMPYLRKNSGKASGAIITFYEITELKKLLQELDLANKNLDASNYHLDNSNKSLLRINADLNNFVFGASHDLNAPIVNIEMLLEILNDKLDTRDPEIIELSGMMNKAVTNFKVIIHDLARVGYLESEDLPDKQESFTALFEEIKETLSEQIRMSAVVFKTNFRIKEVRFAKKNLRSIMLNLITNALKFSSPDRVPEISIKTERKDQFIILTITDNGIGINSDEIDLIFKKYKRVNTETEGTGVGLYLIRKIVNASGGKIEVECARGKGCTFSIFFNSPARASRKQL